MSAKIPMGIALLGLGSGTSEAMIETVGWVLIFAVASALVVYRVYGNAAQMYAEHLESKRGPKHVFPSHIDAKYRDAEYSKFPLPEHEQRSLQESATRAGVLLASVALLQPKTIVAEPSATSRPTKYSVLIFMPAGIKRWHAKRTRFVVASSDAMMGYFLAHIDPWKEERFEGILGETKSTTISAVTADLSLLLALSGSKRLGDTLRAIAALSEEISTDGFQIWVELGEERVLEQGRVSLLEQLIQQAAILQNELDEIDVTDPLT